MGVERTNAPISRRGLLRSGAAGAAGLALGAPVADARRRRNRRRVKKADVAVIGAGFAGLVAAREIARAGKSVIVLEARERVGGRVLNHPIGGGHVVEVGAQWAGPTQDHVFALADSLGVETFPTYNEGENVYYKDGNRSTYPVDTPLGNAPPDPEVLPDIIQIVARLNDMSTQVPVDAPWEAPDAASWDAQTLQDWLDATSLSERFKDLAAVVTEAVFGTEPVKPSLLFSLFYIAAAGNETTPGTFERLFQTGDGAQESRFVGGSQLIAFALADEIGKRRIKLGREVRRIERTGRGLRVETHDLAVRAKRAIVAIPPPLVLGIDFEPKMPRARRRLLRRLPMGNLIKCEAVYDTPFWRDEGLTGQAVSYDGPCRATFDNSPPEGKPGVILGFVGGADADHYSSRPRALREAVLRNFANYYGERALEPRDYIQKIWHNEAYTVGCPVAVGRPGALTSYGPALRKPVGRIHWAGTETSTFWNGYMDGALRSGERAAAEVLEQL